MIWAISAIGFLLLIVVGVVGIGWYFWRDKQAPDAEVKFENMSRFVTALYLSQIYQVDVEQLQSATTPQEMEERAGRLQAEKELATLRGDETPPASNI